MKRAVRFGVTLAIGLVPWVGCKKAPEPAAEPQPIQMWGVRMDSPRLSTDFTNGSPEVQQSAARVHEALRHGQLPRAAAELEQLAENPGLTTVQKKLVADLREQISQVLMRMQSAPPAR